MKTTPSIDAVLAQWGDRLFDPHNRIVKADPAPRLHRSIQERAAVNRQRIEAAVVRRAPQAILRIAGGGRGMGAISSHFRYITRGGDLDIEDDRGVRHTGKESVRDLLNQWRYSGPLIEHNSYRREAFNFVLSTPPGTDAQLLLKAVREFAQAEMGEHLYVMVLHEDRAHPHVHLTVRNESRSGQRLPTWTERERWRTVFAEKLRGLGIDVEATRQSARGENRNFDTLGRLMVKGRGELHTPKAPTKTGPDYLKSRGEAALAWAHIMKALEASESAEDRWLAEHIAAYIRTSPFYMDVVAARERQTARVSRTQADISLQPGSARTRTPPEFLR